MASRLMSWADTRIPGTALVVGTPIELNLLANAPTVDTLTVVRIVIDVHVAYLINVTSTDSSSMVDLGIGVTSGEAFAVGGTALPKPSATTEYPPRGWLYINSQPVQELVATEGVQRDNAHFKADLRAMRKIDKGILFLTMENFNVVVGGAMSVFGRVRVLCKS